MAYVKKKASELKVGDLVINRGRIEAAIESPVHIRVEYRNPEQLAYSVYYKCDSPVVIEEEDPQSPEPPSTKDSLNWFISGVSGNGINHPKTNVFWYSTAEEAIEVAKELVESEVMDVAYINSQIATVYRHNPPPTAKVSFL
jgi:hypothetical protein